MGIRLQKQLGYALTDFEYDKESWTATDPRIDLDLFNDSDERLYDLEQEFAEWAVSNPEEVKSYIVDEMGLDSIDAMLARMSLAEMESSPFHTVLFFWAGGQSG